MPHCATALSHQTVMRHSYPNEHKPSRQYGYRQMTVVTFAGSFFARSRDHSCSALSQADNNTKPDPFLDLTLTHFHRKRSAARMDAAQTHEQRAHLLRVPHPSSTAHPRQRMDPRAIHHWSHLDCGENSKLINQTTTCSTQTMNLNLKSPDCPAPAFSSGAQHWAFRTFKVPDREPEGSAELMVCVGVGFMWPLGM